MENEQNLTIDLTKGNELNEFYNYSYLTMMGAQLKSIMGAMFGSGNQNPFSAKIIGTPQQIKTFAKVLAAEKRYMDAFNKHGLNSSSTYNSRYTLDRAVSNFERDTGLPWPFK